MMFFFQFHDTETLVSLGICSSRLTVNIPSDNKLFSVKGSSSFDSPFKFDFNDGNIAKLVVASGVR